MTRTTRWKAWQACMGEGEGEKACSSWSPSPTRAWTMVWAEKREAGAVGSGRGAGRGSRHRWLTHVGVGSRWASQHLIGRQVYSTQVVAGRYITTTWLNTAAHAACWGTKQASKHGRQAHAERGVDQAGRRGAYILMPLIHSCVFLFA